MSIYSPPETPPPQRRVKPLPKRQRTPPSASPPLVAQDYYMPVLANLLEEARIEGGNAKKRKVPHAIGGEVQGRLSRVTSAGIQFKDSVRIRRKHLEGLVEEGEAEVVEKALMLGLLGAGDREGKRRRLSRRPVLRGARTRLKTTPLKMAENFAFTFHVPSEATDMLRQTKHAVDLLRKRLAAAPKKKPPPPPALPAIKPPPLPPASTKKKKKKRSALANASNPHHLRNYVPSRVPGAETQTSNSDFAYVRFLNAELPPRKSKKETSSTGPTPPAQGTNEWICAFCEYELFYGGDEEYRQAVRRRKKILKRRRRAKERAARGVAGKRAAEKAEQDDELPSEDEVDLFPDVAAPANRPGGGGAKAEVAGRELGYG